MRPLTLPPELLRRVDSLRELDDAALEVFARLAVGTSRTRGEVVIEPSAQTRDACFITSGQMRVNHDNTTRATTTSPSDDIAEKRDGDIQIHDPNSLPLLLAARKVDREYAASLALSAHQSSGPPRGLTVASFGIFAWAHDQCGPA